MLRLAPGVAARLLHYGDEVIVFNPLSWQTHVLNPAAALVLDLVAEAPTDRAALLAALSDALIDDERAAAPRHLDTTLSELLALGLVVDDAAA